MAEQARERLADSGKVSVIVPVRNEEACLGACLESLMKQRAGEILVVDDDSTDRTRAIAAAFDGVRVISAGPLPEGWCGKQHACQAGADAARGTWLLFTDADTVHEPGSLARALEEVQKAGAAMLSYSPAQDVHGLAQCALMPHIFADLAVAYKPAEVSNPNSQVAAANGQYLLISREAYEAIGGHASVASNLLEDVALARRVKQSGRKLLFRYGGDAVRTRMYRSFAQMREGWTKNLALLFPDPRALAARRTIEFFASTVAVPVAVVAALLGLRTAVIVLGIIAVPT